MSGEAVARRIREASDATDLDPAKRLWPKIGMSGQAVARRIRSVSQLRDLCLALGRSGRAARTDAPDGPATSS